MGIGGANINNVLDARNYTDCFSMNGEHSEHVVCLTVSNGIYINTDRWSGWERETLRTDLIVYSLIEYRQHERFMRILTCNKKLTDFASLKKMTFSQTLLIKMSPENKMQLHDLKEIWRCLFHVETSFSFKQTFLQVQNVFDSKHWSIRTHDSRKTTFSSVAFRWIYC